MPSPPLPAVVPETSPPLALQTPPMPITGSTPLQVDNAQLCSLGSAPHWGFLATVAFLDLPRWPGSVVTPRRKRRGSWRDRSLTPESFHRSLSPSPSPAVLEVTPPATPCSEPANPVSAKMFPLLQLLSIPPIASSIASALYGHDLRTLRSLNREFYEFLYPRRTMPTFDFEDAEAGEGAANEYNEEDDFWRRSITDSETGIAARDRACATEQTERLVEKKRAEENSETRRSYYHVLMRKTLLCPRTGCEGETEPRGRKCTSAGGNVGPCIFCRKVICETCISPEIWTINRYRYLCPSCISPRRQQRSAFNAPPTPVSAPLSCNNLNVTPSSQLAFSFDPRPPSSSDTPYNPLTHRPSGPRRGYCFCQANPWVCRNCYTERWVNDISYARAEWSKSHKCWDCGKVHDHSTDPRLPPDDNSVREEKVKRGRGLFISWVMEPVSKSRLRSPLASSPSSTNSKDDSPTPESKSSESKTLESKKPEVERKNTTKTKKTKLRLREKATIRPVACSWCSKRVDADCEEWTAVPESIRRGQEKGRLRKEACARVKAESRVA